VTSTPQPSTEEGRAGLAAIVREPGRALVATDFDGTLSPIVSDPSAARPHPAALAALRRLAPLVGTLAVITGRPAGEAAELGGFAGIDGLIVLGQYGLERWEEGRLTSPPALPGVSEARERLPGVIAAAAGPNGGSAASGIRVEDKGHALAVHTRRAADPAGALRMLAGPLADLASASGLVCEPGRFVIELRPPGTDKGAALSGLAAERQAGAVMFAGDDLGDLAAFSAVRALRASGHPGLTVCSASAEVTELAAQADLTVDGPPGFGVLLAWLAGAITPA
jgi:trehalose 6-phosphate phosphatase